jgi:hypothetical protein
VNPFPCDLCHSADKEGVWVCSLSKTILKDNLKERKVKEKNIPEE